MRKGAAMWQRTAEKRVYGPRHCWAGAGEGLCVCQSMAMVCRVLPPTSPIAALILATMSISSSGSSSSGATDCCRSGSIISEASGLTS